MSNNHTIIKNSQGEVLRCTACKTWCVTFNECKLMQGFQQLITDYKKHKNIGIEYAPVFNGKKQYLTRYNDEFERIAFADMQQPYGYRFVTITCDPKKFTFNEISKPDLLYNYLFNVISELKYLFVTNPVIIMEYTKKGVPHFHMTYTCAEPAHSAGVLLRLRYYFASSMQNRYCIHDRIFNNGGKEYLQKYATHFYTLRNFVLNN